MSEGSCAVDRTLDALYCCPAICEEVRCKERRRFPHRKQRLAGTAVSVLQRHIPTSFSVQIAAPAAAHNRQGRLSRNTVPRTLMRSKVGNFKRQQMASKIPKEERRSSKERREHSGIGCATVVARKQALTRMTNCVGDAAESFLCYRGASHSFSLRTFAGVVLRAWAQHHLAARPLQRTPIACSSWRQPATRKSPIFPQLSGSSCSEKPLKIGGVPWADSSGVWGFLGLADVLAAMKSFASQRSSELGCAVPAKNILPDCLTLSHRNFETISSV